MDRQKTLCCKRDMSCEWDAAVQEFEQRIGGAKLEALERGDERAVQIASRSLRKEALKLMSADATRKKDNS